ncbi:ABC transporter, solute-binding protein [plant metagenome]
MHTLCFRLAGLAALLACATALPAPLSFQDMLGQAVSLDGPTRQAVTLPMPAASLFISLDGGTAHLAGLHPNAYALMQAGPVAGLFPGLAGLRRDVTRTGFAPNVETLLQIQPDLVWQWGHMGDDLLAPLRAAGLPVAALRYGNESRTREWIRLMGIALGQEARAEAQRRWRVSVRADIAAVTGSLPEQARPAVLYLSRLAPQLRSAGRGSSFDDDITLAGGRNVAAAIGGSQVINIEQIMAWAPEVILLNNFEPGVSPAQLYADPLYADIPAVRNRRVYKIPAGGYPWDPPSQESPLYWQWLSLMLHPDKFSWPLRERIAHAYTQLYGHALNRQDIDAILHLSLNAEGAAYARLR